MNTGTLMQDNVPRHRRSAPRRSKADPSRAPLTAASVRAALRAVATPARAVASARFFKTGKGEYGEGDVFIGVAVPAQRAVARAHRGLPLSEIARLLDSRIHEERLTALFLLVARNDEGDTDVRRACFDFYLQNLARVDNWDLVDSSAPQIVGAQLLERGARERRLLDRLARSASLWERRVAMIATAAFIRAGEADDALRLAASLLGDEHDLMHKAVGWMLREVGDHVSVKILRDFLARHAPRMPRTALRYAIEKLPPAERKKWLAVPRDKHAARKPPAVGSAHRSPKETTPSTGVTAT